mmetsp:Transcript_56967/g.169937  ORF Transcript_56967/g.169937 Transcript_56967/m.169937 type:complete len:93 (+) Transcript_56967:282-560(+)
MRSIPLLQPKEKLLQYLAHRGQAVAKGKEEGQAGKKRRPTMRSRRLRSCLTYVDCRWDWKMLPLEGTEKAQEKECYIIIPSQYALGEISRRL